MRNMLKLTVCLLLVVSLFCVTEITCFADAMAFEISDCTDDKRNEMNLVDSNMVSKDIAVTEYGYLFKNDDMEIVFPKNNSRKVVLKSEGNVDIVKSLPISDDFSSTITDTGSVYYCSGKEGYSIVAEAVIRTNEFSTIESLQTRIIVNDVLSQKEYCFEYDLPQGYRLVRDRDYRCGMDEAYVNCNSVFILDAAGNIISVIDPSYALDANGDKINTHYRIEGNSLIQVIEFDSTSAFPIVAYSSDHPNKYTEMRFTKSQAIVMRNSYTGTPLASFISNGASVCTMVSGYLASSFNYAMLSSLLGGLGGVWTLISFAGSLYNFVNYSTWNSIVNGFNGKTYAVIRHTWHYHPGQGTYYPTGHLSCTYSNS